MTNNEIDKIKSLHPDLIRVIDRAKKLGANFKIICATRGKAEQEKAKASGNSKASFGKSAHNYNPALGFDYVPTDINDKVPLNVWTNIKAFIFVSKIIIHAANDLNIKIVYGGNWRSIKDYPHIELENWRNMTKNLSP